MDLFLGSVDIMYSVVSCMILLFGASRLIASKRLVESNEPRCKVVLERVCQSTIQSTSSPVVCLVSRLEFGSDELPVKLYIMFLTTRNCSIQ